MVSLKTLQCPRCGAEVKLDDRGERATCSFCGTVAYTERAGAKGAPIVVVKHHAVALLSLSLGAIALTIAAVVLLRAAPSAPTANVPRAPSGGSAMRERPAPPEKKVAPVEPAVVRSVASFAPARLVDGDGDGRDELLVPIERREGAVRSARFALYALPTLALLRETEALDDPARALAAVAHRRLVLAQPNGELRAYDLASGDRQWTSALGERVAALCAAEAKHADAIQVATEDGRNLLIDVVTGRQASVRAPCPYPLAVAVGRHHPSDRRDYRAPREVRAYTCGGVRVMGSQNYAVPDACKAQLKIDGDRLEGVVAHAIWSLGRRALVLGVRKPGAYVPTVGVREGARWIWKSEVPRENPLEAEQGGPRLLSLHGGSLVIAYASEDRAPVADALRTRRWHADLDDGAPCREGAAARDRAERRSRGRACGARAPSVCAKRRCLARVHRDAVTCCADATHARASRRGSHRVMRAAEMKRDGRAGMKRR